MLQSELLYFIFQAAYSLFNFLPSRLGLILHLRFFTLVMRHGGNLLRRGLLATGMAAFAGGALADATSNFYSDAMLAVAEGRLNDAETAMILLTTSEPRHAGAMLDLATLFCAAGKGGAAERLFVEIEQRFAPPGPILDVINQQRRLGCNGWQAKGDVTIKLSRGVESNANRGAQQPIFLLGSGVNQVALVLLPQYLPHSDQSTSFSAEVVRELSPNGASAVLELQSHTYDQLSDNGTTSLLVGVEWPGRWKGWGLRGSGSLGAMTVGSRLYSKQSQIQLEVIPPLPLLAHWQVGLMGGLSGVAYPTLSGFDALWTQVQVALRYRRDDFSGQLSASALQDRGTIERPGGHRSGVFVDFQTRRDLAPRVVGELGWLLRRWEGTRAYSPGLLDVTRLQQTRVLRAALSYQLSAQQALIFEFKNTRNDENISIFNYRNRALQLSWQWQPLKRR
jgi:hypothetical protein